MRKGFSRTFQCFRNAMHVNKVGMNGSNLFVCFPSTAIDGTFQRYSVQSKQNPSKQDPYNHDPSNHDPSKHDPYNHDPYNHDPSKQDQPFSRKDQAHQRTEDDNDGVQRSDHRNDKETKSDKGKNDDPEAKQKRYQNKLQRLITSLYSYGYLHACNGSEPPQTDVDEYFELHLLNVLQNVYQVDKQSIRMLLEEKMYSRGKSLFTLLYLADRKGRQTHGRPWLQRLEYPQGVFETIVKDFTEKKDLAMDEFFALYLTRSRTQDEIVLRILEESLSNENETMMEFLQKLPAHFPLQDAFGPFFILSEIDDSRFFATKLNIFEFCQGQYFLRYDLGIQSKRTSNVASGATLHEADQQIRDAQQVAKLEGKKVDKKEIKKSLKEKYEQSVASSMETLPDEEERNKRIKESQKEWNNVKDRLNETMETEDLEETNIQSGKTIQKPSLFTEVPFSFEMGGRTLVGRIDTVRIDYPKDQDPIVTIIELKRRNFTPIKRNLQLMVYALGYEWSKNSLGRPHKLKLESLTRRKSTEELTLTDEFFDRAQKKLEKIIKRMHSPIYKIHPTARKCAVCHHQDVCPFKFTQIHKPFKLAS